MRRHFPYLSKRRLDVLPTFPNAESTKNKYCFNRQLLVSRKQMSAKLSFNLLKGWLQCQWSQSIWAWRKSTQRGWIHCNNTKTSIYIGIVDQVCFVKFRQSKSFEIVCFADLSKNELVSDVKICKSVHCGAHTNSGRENRGANSKLTHGLFVTSRT